MAYRMRAPTLAFRQADFDQAGDATSVANERNKNTLTPYEEAAICDDDCYFCQCPETD